MRCVQQTAPSHHSAQIKFVNNQEPQTTTKQKPQKLDYQGLQGLKDMEEVLNQSGHLIKLGCTSTVAQQLARYAFLVKRNSHH